MFLLLGLAREFIHIQAFDAENRHGQNQDWFFVLTKMGRMFFCQVLRNKPEGEKDTVCFQLCLWLNSLCSCYSPQKVQNSLAYIGQNVTHQSTCCGGQVLKNTAIVCEVKSRLFCVQALSISPIACIIQITVSTLVLEFGLQHNLFPASICLSLRDFYLEYWYWAKLAFWNL